MCICCTFAEYFNFNLMKKFILFSIIAISSLSAHAAANTIIDGVPYFDVALDGDKFLYSYSVVKGADVEYTILNDHFEVVKNFTIKGLYHTDEYNRGFRDDDMSVDGIDTKSVIATKGLFTSDGKWCVIFTDNSEPHQSVSYVYNEDGERLFELPGCKDSSDCYVGRISLSNVTLGRPYYMTYVYDSENRVFSYTIWSFDTTSGAKAPEVVRTVPAYPNPLPQGALLTVSLPEAADANTMFVVNDMNGRQVLRRRVHQGETEMTLSPRFGRGTYVYTVIYADGTTASGKLAAE